jgi:hypothetical protein
VYVSSRRSSAVPSHCPRVAFLLGDCAWAVNAQRLEVLLLNLFTVAYSVPRRDHVNPKVLEYLWAPCISQLRDGDFHGSREEPIHRAREHILQQQVLGGAVLLHFWELGSGYFEARPLKHSVPREWGVSRESCKYLLLLIRRVTFTHTSTDIHFFICRERVPQTEFEAAGPGSRDPAVFPTP